MCPGLFEVRAQEYLDSLPGSEQRGVNKFLKGLGKIYSTASSNQHNSMFCYICCYIFIVLFFFRKQNEISF